MRVDLGLECLHRKRIQIAGCTFNLREDELLVCGLLAAAFVAEELIEHVLKCLDFVNGSIRLLKLVVGECKLKPEAGVTAVIDFVAPLQLGVTLFN